MNIDKLFDESLPFDGEKLQIFETLVNDIYSGDPNKM